ncbi:MAG: rod shape-determining protein MreC [Solirubrobacterales bacterium]|nr:rod shape-determining protein MreC [Solirubrobacterales bacterium]
MYRKQVRRRRAVLVALIVVSLVLLSSHFSEAESGPLHTIQRGVAAVLSPIGEGAERALKPARDLINWFDETFEARGENEQLEEEIAALRAQVSESQDAVGDNAEFKQLLKLDRSPALGGYEPVTARVIGRSPTVWFSTLIIDQGSSSRIERNDPVINFAGLVGRVGDLTGGTAQVELITDPDNAVSAEVLPTADTDDAVTRALSSDNPTGIVAPVAGDPEDLLLDFIDKQEPIEENQILITAGWSNGNVSSAYPPGLPIGRVTEAEEGEQEEFQRIHVSPFADLRDIEHVQVLTGGPDRPGVPG